MTIGRNDPCPCGSGKKYKKCCAAKDEAKQSAALAARAAQARTGEAQKPAQRKGFKGSGAHGGEGAARTRAAPAQKPNLPRRGAV